MKDCAASPNQATLSLEVYLLSTRKQPIVVAKTGGTKPVCRFQLNRERRPRYEILKGVNSELFQPDKLREMYQERVIALPLPQFEVGQLGQQNRQKPLNS